jgi:hypothetical protein
MAAAFALSSTATSRPLSDAHARMEAFNRASLPARSAFFVASALAFRCSFASLLAAFGSFLRRIFACALALRRRSFIFAVNRIVRGSFFFRSFASTYASCRALFARSFIDRGRSTCSVSSTALRGVFIRHQLAQGQQ